VKTKWGLTIGAALSAVALAACGGSGDSASNEGNSDLFTSAGFQKAYDAVTDEAGENVQALETQITDGGATFKLRNGEQATGFIYTGGELHDVKVDVIGTGSLEGQDYPFSEVDPEAIDKIISGIKQQAGVPDLKVIVMTLAQSPVDGQLKWTMNAEGGGRTGLVYTAEPDGSNVTSPTQTAQGITDCIQKAGTDVAKIQGCTQ
jgi:hypothetical protein